MMRVREGGRDRGLGGEGRRDGGRERERRERRERREGGSWPVEKTLPRVR